jgi:hypothetical protein
MLFEIRAREYEGRNVRLSRIVIRRDAGSTRLMRLASTRLATVLVAVMAISPVLGALHDASVRHVACPDDGELIEAPVQRAHAHAPAGKERALFPELPIAPSAPGADHDHCAISVHSRGTFGVTSSRPASGFFAPAATPSSAVPEQPGTRELALYRLAPKASPPR